MFFGIQAGQTTVVSRIARELDEDILLKKTEERLSRHLLDEGLAAMVQRAVLAQGAAYVQEDTIVSIDPSDIQKPYAREGGMPMMLLTTLRAARSRRSLRQVVEGYLTRWRVEETIRFVKQSYEVEDVRLLRFDRLRAMVAIVLATAYFAMAWLGLGDRLAVLADHVKRVSRRMFETPEFFFYAIADGICRLFARHGRWNGLDGPDETPEEPCQMILAL